MLITSKCNHRTRSKVEASRKVLEYYTRTRTTVREAKWRLVGSYWSTPEYSTTLARDVVPTSLGDRRDSHTDRDYNLSINMFYKATPTMMY